VSYYYQAYDLVFCSDLECPELPSHAEPGDKKLASDVTIRVGTVPETLQKPVSSGIVYQASTDQFLLSMQNIARYLVQNGNEIIIEPANGADLNEVRVFMLGSAFGALLHQRQLLVLHASALYTDKGAVLFAGPSGIGKSTLLGEMLRRGYQMMVDDICAVVLNEQNKLLVLPAYPRTRLWKDAARKLDICTDKLTRTRSSLEKFERQVPDQFWSQRAPLRHIYTLGTSNKQELSLTPLPAIHAFSTILLNTYRSAFLDGLEMRQPHFHQASTVASTTGLSRVVRPSGEFQLAELADLIEEDMAG